MSGQVVENWCDRAKTRKATKVELHLGTSCAETASMKSKDLDMLGARRNLRMWRWGAMLAVTGAVSTGGGVALAEIQLKYQSPTFAERAPDARASTPAQRWIINRDECNTEDASFTFKLDAPGFNGMNGYFEVWGTLTGADCTQLDQRNTGTPDKPVANQGTCFAVAHKGEPTATQSSFSITVDVATMVGLKPELAECGTLTDDITPRALKLYFMFTSGGTIQGQALVWPPMDVVSTLDLWGPAPPTDVTVSSGEGSITVSPDGTKEAGATDVVYCAKGGQILGTEVTEDTSSCSCSGVGDGATGSAGSAGTTNTSSSSSSSSSSGSSGAGGGGGAGGSGGSSGNNGECVTTPLVENALPDATWVPCADGATTVEDLENNEVYAIAVAYRDQVGNVGKLSPIVCATPEPVDDFFEVYQQNGGQAGGGYCSMAPRTLRNTTFGTAFALGAMALVVRRRNRLSRNASSKEVSK